MDYPFMPRRGRASTGENLVCISTILARGWTASMVERLLGEPDILRPNPRYRKAAPMRFCRWRRVVKAKRSDEFKDLLERANQSCLASAKGVETKQATTLKLARKKLKLKLPVVRNFAELQQLACDYYNDYHAESIMYGHKQPAALDAPPEFLDRILLNYLRHDCSNYDRVLASLSSMVGQAEARAMLRTIIEERVQQRLMSHQSVSYSQTQSEACHG